MSVARSGLLGAPLARALLAASAAFAGSCSSRTIPVGQCLFNADCPQGMVCSAQQCRASCATDRDCPTGLRCLPTATRGSLACVPEGAVQSCTHSSECMAGQRCAPEGYCVAECQADYDCQLTLHGAVCVGGRCTRPDAGNDAGEDASTDAQDSGPEALPEAAPDATPEVTVEAGFDSAAEPTTEPAGAEATPERAPETGPEAGLDAPLEAGPEAGLDAAPDAAPDSEMDSGPEAGPDVLTETGSTGSCPLGQTLCGAVCADLATDLEHCGGCAMPCATAVPECLRPSCMLGTCGTEVVPADTPLRGQIAGDCARLVCDGLGSSRQELDPADLPPPSMNPCLDAVCNMVGMPDYASRAPGSPCALSGGGAGFCDGAPTPSCVACLGDMDCTTPTPRCDTTAHACVGDTVLLVAGTGATGNPVLAASYSHGLWTSAMVPPPPGGLYDLGGGGVAVTGLGTGIAVLRGNTDAGFYSTRWSGGWSPLRREGTASIGVFDAPRSAAGGAVVGYDSGGTVLYSRYYSALDSWIPLGEASSLGVDSGAPSLVLQQGGDPLVASASSSGSYAWSSRGTGWTPATDFPGGTYSMLLSNPAVALERRAGTDDLVAVFTFGTVAQTLSYATRTAGVWSAPVSLMTSLDLTSVRPFTLAALPDGRVALACASSLGSILVGFYDGTSWTPLRAVPSTSGLYLSRFPVSLARGANGEAELELAFTATPGPRHTRLVDSSRWLWTAPVTVQPLTGFGLVSLSVGP